MIPLETIPCRWRETTEQSNVFDCQSPKIKAPHGVTSEQCSQCFCRNHEPISPEFAEKVMNLIKSVKEHVHAGFTKTSEEERLHRLTICETCPFFTKNRSCSKCGCAMDIKAGWLDQKCPENKW